ncbi:MAG: thiamine pyrophosphate-binding protein [Deltaproteobacteria bacterium]|nr:thiamine pyrophosphate-binding protein [Deltaproteobacteria bacterium]
MMRRIDALKIFTSLRKDEICICGVGVSGRELYSIGHHQLNLYNVNMPYPLSLGLGLALAIPQRRTIVLDGDGSLLSGCSTLSVVGNVRPGNLLIVVWDNESYVTPYGLPTPTAGFTDLAAVARGMGIPNVAIATNLDEFETALKDMLMAREVGFLVAKVDKSIPSDLAAYPFGLTENSIQFRRALVNDGLVDPFHAGASLPKTMEFKL